MAWPRKAGLSAREIKAKTAAFTVSEQFEKKVEIMQMFLLCYPDFLDDSVTNEFSRAGYKSHMKLHDATGLDQPHGGTRGSMRTPGKINALFMYMSDEEVPRTLGIVQRLKEKYPKERLRALTWALKECY